MFRSAPRVNHLLYVDDCLIFNEASMEGASNLLTIIWVYASCFDQLINFGKSCVLFSSNVNAFNRAKVVHILGVLTIDSIKKYLGLSCVLGRGKMDFFFCYS